MLRVCACSSPTRNCLLPVVATDLLDTIQPHVRGYVTDKNLHLRTCRQFNVIIMYSYL